jgi:putative ABC transport system permease protein
MNRVLWQKAPFVLARHPGALVAVVCSAFLVALAASSAPLLQAGAESQALKSKVGELTPLAAGLVIRTPPATAPNVGGADQARRRAAAGLAASLPNVRAPVVTSFMLGAGVVGPAVEEFAPNGLDVVPMSRTGARAHVKLVAGSGRDGVWIAQSVANTARLRPGDRIRLTQLANPGGPAVPTVSLPVAAVYRTLDGDLGNPYWVNFIHEIRPVNPDSPPLPTFLLMSPQQLYRLAHAIGHNVVANVYELPIEPGALTLGRTKRLSARFADVRRELAAGETPLAHGLGCKPTGRSRGCDVTSALTSALALARQSVRSLTPALALLAGFGSLLALAAAVAAGVFGVRRRIGEAQLLHVRGERSAVFAARSALEALLPALAGGAAGFGAATALTASFTPSGTIDGDVLRSALLVAVLATAAAILAIALGAAAGFPGRRAAVGALRRARVPWEPVVLAAAAGLYIVLDHGGGLVRNGAAGSHPRLAVFVLPLLAAAGLAGLATRLVRRALRRPAGGAPPLYLARRRLAAARGLLVLLTVTAAVSFGAFAYAEALASSLDTNTSLKAYVANGSDVSSIVDPSQTLPAGFPYPVAKVSQSFNTARLTATGSSVELLAGDPAAMASVIHWRGDWGRDPRPALRRLAQAPGTPLPILVSADAGSPTALWLAGRRVPARVVGTVDAFPGMTFGQPLVVASQRQLDSVEQRLDVPTDQGLPYSLLWAKGPTAAVEAALVAHHVDPYYLTSVAHILDSPDVTNVTRTYGFMRAVAVAAGLLSLVALLLYLQARQRTQLVSNAFLRRMGMRGPAQAASLALEAAGLVLFSTVIGTAAALVAARPLIPHVDPLPTLPPSAVLHVPWVVLAIAVLVAVAVAALAGAAASAAAARGKVGEALRVA